MGGGGLSRSCKECGCVHGPNNTNSCCPLASNYAGKPVPVGEVEDRDLDALRAVHRVLAGLPRDQRVRMIQCLAVLYGVKPKGEKHGRNS